MILCDRVEGKSQAVNGSGGVQMIDEMSGCRGLGQRG